MRPIQRWAYALPNLSISMLVMPIAVVVPSLYVKERGIALATMGVILMVARIFDAVADQVVGYLSDITRDRIIGGRKAWLVLGMLVGMPSIYLLCAPPEGAGVVYFTVCSLVAYLCWAMLLIPHTAWGAELSRDYNERTRIVTARSIVGQFGTLAFLIVPILLPTLGLASTTETTLNSSRYVALVLLILLPLTIIPAILLAPRGAAVSLAPPPRLLETLKAMWANKPMRVYGGAFLIAEFGYGVFVSLIFLYLDSYLGLGAKFSHIVIAANVAMLVTLPLWDWAARRFGKKQASALAWLLNSLSLLALLFVDRSASPFIPATVIICVLSVFAGAAAVLAPSILGDIIDYDTFKTGAQRAGNYFALYSLINKIVVAVGGGAAMTFLGLLGYDVAHPEANGPAQNSAMVWTFVLAPAVLRIVALGLLWSYPLDARSQATIRRRLEQREARAARVGVSA
jgi:glycoside/pentoside/hexuronide:cation symporter, GPH family